MTQIRDAKETTLRRERPPPGCSEQGVEDGVNRTGTRVLCLAEAKVHLEIIPQIEFGIAAVLVATRHVIVLVTETVSQERVGPLHAEAGGSGGGGRGAKTTFNCRPQCTAVR